MTAAVDRVYFVADDGCTGASSGERRHDRGTHLVLDLLPDPTPASPGAPRDRQADRLLRPTYGVPRPEAVAGQRRRRRHDPPPGPEPWPGVLSPLGSPTPEHVYFVANDGRDRLRALGPPRAAVEGALDFYTSPPAGSSTPSAARRLAAGVVRSFAVARPAAASPPPPRWWPPNLTLVQPSGQGSSSLPQRRPRSLDQHPQRQPPLHPSNNALLALGAGASTPVLGMTGAGMADLVARRLRVLRVAPLAE